MPAADHARLTIDFDLRGDLIAGVVRDGGGNSEPFAGWMALTRTIERALDAARHAEQDIPADVLPARSLADGALIAKIPGEHRP